MPNGDKNTYFDQYIFVKEQREYKKATNNNKCVIIAYKLGLPWDMLVGKLGTFT